LQKGKAMQTGNRRTDTPFGTVGEVNGILDLAFGFWRSALLLSADELGVFGALAREAAAAPEVGKRLGIGAEATADLLDALAQIGLVERYSDGFRNAPVAARFLDPGAPEYIGRWLHMARAALRDTEDLTRRLRLSGAETTAETQPTERMWADIAAILETDHAER
jgi:hypothetical protein